MPLGITANSILNSAYIILESDDGCKPIINKAINSVKAGCDPVKAFGDVREDLADCEFDYGYRDDERLSLPFDAVAWAFNKGYTNGRPSEKVIRVVNNSFGQLIKDVR